MLYLYVFCGIIAAVIFAAVIFSIVSIRKKEQFQKDNFNKESLLKYEQMLNDFYASNGIAAGETLSAICEKLGITVQPAAALSGHKEATLSDDGGKTTVSVLDKLSLKNKQFAIAHEVAHLVKGDPLPVARLPHNFFERTLEEQICDYIAAAILLPQAELLKRLTEGNFSALSYREKGRFIQLISDEKDIGYEVVERRIKEVRLLVNN